MLEFGSNCPLRVSSPQLIIHADHLRCSRSCSATASQLLLVYLDSSTFSQYPIRTVTVLSKSILTHFGAHFGLGFPSQYYWRFQTKRNKINLTFFTLVPISRRLSILSGLVSPKLVSLTGVKLQINIGNQCNLVF